MKFFTVSCFFHISTAESSDAVCNHAGCEAAQEESTLLQLGNLGKIKNKNKVKSFARTRNEDGLEGWAVAINQIDQRLLTGMSYKDAQGDGITPNWDLCIDRMEEDRSGGPLDQLSPATFEAWHACLDEAEEEDGIKAWLEGGGQAQSLISLSVDKKTNTSYAAPLEHLGSDCWSGCGHRGGACNWCGSQGACCRSGWGNDPAECGGNGGHNYHTCILRADTSSSGAVVRTGQDCWAPCGSQGGPCAFCGTQGVCCREGWGGHGCGGRGGHDYHTCVYPDYQHGPDRHGVPTYCDPNIPNTHDPCSCHQVHTRINEYHMWIQYASSGWADVRTVGYHRAMNAARCGWMCPTKADWHPAPANPVVRAGDQWTLEYGVEVEHGFERTDYTESEISNTMEVSYGFEFYGFSAGGGASSTQSVRSGVSRSISQTTGTERVQGHSRTWNVNGYAWQAKTVTRDTCGGTLRVTTDEYTLTPNPANPPRCFPGFCYINNVDGYCCSCYTGGELSGVPQCEHRCPYDATVNYYIGHSSGQAQSDMVALNPGIEMNVGQQITLQCADYGRDFSGTALVECAHGGQLVVIGAQTTCTRSR